MGFATTLVKRAIAPLTTAINAHRAGTAEAQDGMRAARAMVAQAAAADSAGGRAAPRADPQTPHSAFLAFQAPSGRGVNAAGSQPGAQRVAPEPPKQTAASDNSSEV